MARFARSGSWTSAAVSSIVVCLTSLIFLLLRSHSIYTNSVRGRLPFALFSRSVGIARNVSDGYQKFLKGLKAGQVSSELFLGNAKPVIRHADVFPRHSLAAHRDEVFTGRERISLKSQNYD